MSAQTGGIGRGALLALGEALYGRTAAGSDRRPDRLAALGPAAALYGAASAARGALAHEARVRLTAPVFSVGGLTLGGSGKTPFVRWLAARLREAGRRPAVLTRGYRWVRRADAPLVLLPVAPAAAGLEASAVPDEAALFVREGLAVGAHPSRARAAAALARAGAQPDVWLLDDGFQHRRLARRLDLVLLSRRDLAAPRRPLPAGPLREPWTALRRAHRIVLTGLSRAQAEVLARRDAAELGLPRGRAPVLAGSEALAFAPLEEWRTGGAAAAPLRARRIVAFSGIADPRAFERALTEAGLAPERHLVHPDHHRFGRADLAALSAATRRGAALVTTEKDAARLPPNALPEGCCWVARAELRIWRGEEALLEDVRSALAEGP